MRHFIPIILLATALVMAGCIGPISNPEGSYDNKLYWVANEAPADSEQIMYVDIGKFMGNPAMAERMGLPPEAGALGMAVKSMRMIGSGKGTSGKDVIIFEGGLGASMVLPMMLGQAAAAGDENMTSVTEEYNGYTVEHMDDMSYFSHGDKIYLGEEAGLKAIIDVKNGAPGAAGTYSEILERLPDGDLLMAAMHKPESKDDPVMMGMSLTMEGNISHTVMVAKFANAATAREQSSQLAGEEMTVNSIDVQGDIVVIEMDFDTRETDGPL